MECPICNKSFLSITNSHTKKHGLTLNEFKELFPTLSTMSDNELKAKQRRAIVLNEKRWSTHRINYEKNPKKCLACGRDIPFSKKRQSFCDLSCSTSHNNKAIWQKIDETHPWRRRRPAWRSRGEKELFSYMKEEYSGFLWQHSKKIIIEGKGMVVDIYSEEIKTIIEYDGRIHFVPYYGEKRLLEVKERDATLQKYCIDHNIKLIRINEKTFKTFEWKEAMKKALQETELIHFLYYVNES